MCYVGECVVGEANPLEGVREDCNSDSADSEDLKMHRLGGLGEVFLL